MVIEFPVFAASLVDDAMFKPRSTSIPPSLTRRTKVPSRKRQGTQNLGQLVGAAKRMIDYYGPMVDEFSTERQERDLFCLLEKAVAPYLRNPQQKMPKLHIMVMQKKVTR